MSTISRKTIVWIILALSLVAILVAAISGINHHRANKKPQFETLSTNTDIGRVYYIHDEDKDRSYVEIIYNVGEADMTGPEGLVHYTEHLVAWNSLSKELKDKSRDFNATTSKTATNYFMTSDFIEEALGYVAATLNPIELSQEYMVEEAKIVKREFALNFEENPQSQLYVDWMREAYRGTGLARSTIGSSQSIANFTPQEAIDIHQEYYDPKQAVLVVHTPLSKKEARRAIEAAFADAPERPERPPRVLLDETLPTTGSSQKVVTNKDLKFETHISLLTTALPPYSRREIDILGQAASYMIQSNQKGMFTRQLEFDQKTYGSIEAYFEIYPGNLGMELALFAEPNGSQDSFLSDLFVEWVKNIDQYPESIEKNWNSFVEQSKDDFENWEAEDALDLLLYQIGQGEEEPLTFAKQIKILDQLQSGDVIDFLKFIAENHANTDQIWKEEK